VVGTIAVDMQVDTVGLELIRSGIG
jgi:hypothetical protein